MCPTHFRPGTWFSTKPGTDQSKNHFFLFFVRNTPKNKDACLPDSELTMLFQMAESELKSELNSLRYEVNLRKMDIGGAGT